MKKARIRTVAMVVSAVSGLTACAATNPPSAPAFAASIDEPLTAAPADPLRGREVVIGRDGNCLLCHAIPETGSRFMGNLGPSLTKVGARLSAGQLRLRLVDSRRLNPQTIMPSYFSTEGLVHVAASYRGKTVLTAQQIEDTIAYLLTLR